MKLEKKKALAARTLNVGAGRIVFNAERLADIKEAITKQDIKDLQNSGAILIREKKGTLKKMRRKTRRRPGSIKKQATPKKKHYITLTRKLRSHLSSLKKKNKLSREEHSNLRKEIRANAFKSLAHMKEKISQQGAEK